MRKLVLTCLATGLMITSGIAQTLFTYGGNPVSKEEFLRVYQKNALNKKPDFSEPALREYLDLYSLFKMKVKEAELMQLDTMASIQHELDNYRKQLARNYLTDEQVTGKLVTEAYNRMKEEVRVAHILVMAPANMTTKDTAVAYQKIDSIYKAITKGKADFAAMAKQYSDDKGSKDNGGEIGYMTALQTVYPFESVVYNTPVGKISTPFRTQLGYHIVKVLDRRRAQGEVQVSQILVNVPKSKGEEGEKEAMLRLDTIKSELKKGVPFAEVAQKYSDDKFTAKDGGLMQPFGVGRVTPVFEKAAFALRNVGDISDPVQTEYGYHIIKLEKKIPLKPFDSVSNSIKHRIENDARSQMARDIYFEKVKQKNGFKEYPSNLEPIVAKLSKLPDTGKNANMFDLKDFESMNQPLFMLGKTNYLQSDFMKYAESITRGRIMGPKEAVVHDLYKMYVSTVVNDFQEHQLLEENEDFRNLMGEYRNGIMLFELMDRKVWGKASKDTVGLKTFYEKNKNKYQWEPGFAGSVYHFKDEASKNEGMKLLAKKGTKDEDVLKQINKETNPDAVTVQHGHYEFSRFKDVPQTAIIKGKISTPEKNADGSYTVVKADDVYNTASVKALEDARGYAVAEYQDYLEKQWNQELRTKYPVKVNEEVFKSMVK